MILIFFAGRLQAAEAVSTNLPKFLGATSCSSSGCHGGAGQHQNQSLVWSLRDFHSQRPFATLTTARARQIAEALMIKDPVADSRCTSCHAPLQDVPASLCGENFKISEGVSCESCHGPAENWLRAHTRSDWTHADRVFAGMRDFKNLYVRANTCVACHQTVESPLLKAGHPELIFELDGQGVAEPKHWREAAEWNGAQTWWIGQAVALREMSWQLSRESGPDEKLLARWGALLWLLQKLDGLDPQVTSLNNLPSAASPQNFQAVLKASDELARQIAAVQWTDEMSQQALRTLAGIGAEFQQHETPVQLQARRAERLVLALDRLLLAQKNFKSGGASDANLNQLFKPAQSLPDFDAVKFAEALNLFALGLNQ